MEQNSSDFEQYMYFKGEAKCPFTEPEQMTWWAFEQMHYHYHSENYTFHQFFDMWVRDKAAPNSGWNLERQGNPWEDRYIENAPD